MNNGLRQQPARHPPAKAGPIKNLIIFLVILGLVLPSFAFAQEQPISPPETLEGAREIGERALEATEKELPGILEKIWREEVLPIWQTMYDWFKENIWSRIVNWFKRDIKPRAKEEIEERRRAVEEELERKTEEAKKEITEEIIPKAAKSLWEKFQELWK